MFTFIFLSAVLPLCGFLCGKLHERLEWNKLIDQGRIQKP